MFKPGSIRDKSFLLAATCLVGSVDALTTCPSSLSSSIRGPVLSSSVLQSRQRSFRVSSRLFYIEKDELEDKESTISFDGNEASKSAPSSIDVPSDFDHLQKLEAVEFIARHVEEITPEIVFHDESSNTPVNAPLIHADDSHISIKPTTQSPTPPSETRPITREILSIALPSLGGMLLDPLMSLIDTACVGQISTTSLAAMAPCTSIFQFAFFAFFFLSAATTNLVASNNPEGAADPKERGERVEFNETVVGNASVLALALGGLVGASLWKFCDPLLRIAGIPSADTALLNAARPYLLIRAAGIPFVFLATVLQGSSLGRGNAWRPLRIFGAAGIVNLAGDVYLTLHKGMGAAGAALATVAAQVGAAVYYAVTTARLDKSVEESSKPKRDVALAWRGLASKSIVETFVDVAITLFFRSIGIMLAYSMLTRAAALGGTAALAAHQVTLQVWWLISFLPEPMSVAAQTLIARDRKDRPWRVSELIKTLYSMSAALGVSASILTLVALRAPAVASALVADAAVQRTIATLVPFAVLSQSYCPLGTLSDGVCIGLGSFGHLPGIMIGSFAATFAALSMVAKYNLGVVGVWGCMNVFLSSRILGHLVASTKLRRYIGKAFGFGREEERVILEAPIGVAA